MPQAATSSSATCTDAIALSTGRWPSCVSARHSWRPVHNSSPDGPPEPGVFRRLTAFCALGSLRALRPGQAFLWVASTSRWTTASKRRWWGSAWWPQGLDTGGQRARGIVQLVRAHDGGGLARACAHARMRELDVALAFAPRERFGPFRAFAHDVEDGLFHAGGEQVFCAPCGVFEHVVQVDRGHRSGGKAVGGDDRCDRDGVTDVGQIGITLAVLPLVGAHRDAKRAALGSECVEVVASRSGAFMVPLQRGR